MFVRVNAIFNTCGVILHEGHIGGLGNSYNNSKLGHCTLSIKARAQLLSHVLFIRLKA